MASSDVLIAVTACPRGRRGGRSGASRIRAEVSTCLLKRPKSRNLVRKFLLGGGACGERGKPRSVDRRVRCHLRVGGRRRAAGARRLLRRQLERRPGRRRRCTLAECTLREAISAAGGTEVVEDTITFSFPASTTISVDSELPAVTADITIDATTVTGYASGSRVVLDGTELAAGDGLHLAGDNGKVTGLVVNDFPNVGILVNGSGAVLDELRVGTDEVGAMDEGNGATASPSSDSPSGRRSRSPTASSRETAATASGSTAITSRSARACWNNTIGMNATGTARSRTMEPASRSRH